MTCPRSIYSVPNVKTTTLKNKGIFIISLILYEQFGQTVIIFQIHILDAKI